MPTHEDQTTYGILYCDGVELGPLAEAPVFAHTKNDEDTEDFVMQLRSHKPMTITGIIDIKDSRAWRRFRRSLRKNRQQTKRQAEKERKHKDA